MNLIFRFILLTVLTLSLTAWMEQSALADNAAEIKNLEGQLQVYRNNVEKQKQNIAKMTAEIQAHPDHPDTSKLNNFFATAGGARTQAYQNEPPYVQALIDKLEADPMLKTLNLTTMSKYPHNVAYGHFLNEIERSQKFIAMLRKAMKDNQAKIDKLKASAATAAKSTDPADFIGKWKYVGGDYEIEVSGSDGAIQGMITTSTPFDPKLPWDYKVGTTMFENGKMQSDGTCKVDWAQYNWESSSLNKVLGRGTTPATLRLKPDKEAFAATGLARVIDSTKGKEKWTNEFGHAFKYSFIKRE